MKVLWLCNLVPPFFSSEFGFKEPRFGGWMDALLGKLITGDCVNLAVCLPIIDEARMKDGIKEGCEYYSFHFSNVENDKQEQIARFKYIIECTNPDVIHIFGTEYLHSYSLVRACREKDILDRVVIHLQGLISEYAASYKFGVPGKVFENESANELEQNRMQQSGVRELEIIRMVDHVSGRTQWDYDFANRINPSVKYHYIQEMMRSVFYTRDTRWNLDTCQRHSIFISQASYPIKGLHLVLEKISKLKDKYQDLKICIAGPKLSDARTPYKDYIGERIDQLKLTDCITYVGMLSPIEMVNELLRANLFLSCAVLENSSNSIGEAMLIGTPIVASNVGGTYSITDGGSAACLYSIENVHEMYEKVDLVFSDDEFSEMLSNRERLYAEKKYDRNEILRTTIEMYREISATADGE